MIVQLRGCSGSGKSTVAHKLLERFPYEEIKRKSDGKIMAYKIDAGLDRPLYLIGSYHTKCGGCDTIPTQQEMIDRVEWFDDHGHVLFEGLLASTVYGAVGKISERKPMIFAYLDTPLDVCLERVKQRRLEKGNDKPLDPTNTTAKWNHIRSQVEKFGAMGKTVVMIDHKKAFSGTLELFK